MTFQTFMTTCTKLWHDYNTLSSYFVDGRMVDLLREIGEADFQAASVALEAARQSGNPSRGVAEAIGCLRVASIEHLAAANKRRYFGLAKASSYARNSSYEIAVEASLLLALCYRYLKETLQAREQLLNARRYFNDYAKSSLDVVEAGKWATAGIGMAATMSDSFDVSSAYEEQETMSTEGMKALIEEERNSLDALIEMDAKMDSTWMNRSETAAEAPSFLT